ncbi:MAG: carboxylesterase family protein, partial [Muribaculaceae bacterium]|nr:carboxylesterase family protein [Muribaculaceae bacterium]
PDELEREIEKRFGDKKEAVKAAVAEAYPDRPLCEVLTVDTSVRSEVLRMANLLAKRGDTPLYVYLFSWVTPLHNGHAMCFRNSEMPFVFNNPEKAVYSRVGGLEAKRLAKIMSRCWTSFARSGNPNNSITPYWRRVNHDQGYTMIFDRDVHLKTSSDLNLMRIMHPEVVKDIKDYSTLLLP